MQASPPTPQAPPPPSGNSRGPYTFRGASLKLLQSQAREVVLSGAAGTGKSRGCLEKLHYLAETHPGMRGLILRRTRESLTESALVTFEDRVLPADHYVLKAGGQRAMRHSYRYRNGSHVTVGGLDKPTRVMSTEYDMIYVQEAIELTEAEWEVLKTRLRNNRMAYQQILGDTNPDAPTHWIKRRSGKGGPLQLLEGSHEDNPSLYHPATGWTREGLSYLANLDSLTGVRYERLRWGRWVQAEGVVYTEWRPAVHLLDPFLIPLAWDRYWAVDFGFTHPFAAGMFAVDHDGRAYLYREVYKTKRLVEDHAKRLLALQEQETVAQMEATGLSRSSVEQRLRPKAIYCDHDAEDRATLQKHLGGLPCTPARKMVRPGIEAVQQRLKVLPDNKARLYILRDSLDERDMELFDAKRPCSIVEEFDSYVWNDKKDEPVKEFDHGMDMLRYLVAGIDRGPWEAPGTAEGVRVPLDPAARQNGIRFGDDRGRRGRLFGR
jgi:hypothetical protein